MIGRMLKTTRIVVSAAIFLLLTGALTYPVLAVPDLTEGLERIQLTMAVMSMSMFIFVVWLIITLVFGRVYCSSVCPMGTLQDIAARAVRLDRRKPRHYRYSRPQNQLRYIMLVAMMVCLMGQYYVASSVIDPYGAYSRICASVFAPAAGLDTPMWSATSTRVAVATWASTLLAAVTLAAVTVTAARRGRLACNTICPVGTTLGLVSRFAIFQIDIDTDKCIQCRRCEEVCKAECINLTDHTVDGSRCVNCFDCLTVCPNDAIHYTNRRKQLSDPMMQRIPDTFRRAAGTSPQSAGASTCTDNIKPTDNETIS